jgi:hypothetical protein
MNHMEDVLVYELAWRIRDAQGNVISAEYIIPDADKEKVLKAHYPFTDPPSLDAEVIDIHVDRPFRVRDFKLLREHGMNWLVSPYYYEAGGTVIDWWDEAHTIDDEADDDCSANPDSTAAQV